VDLLDLLDSLARHERTTRLARMSVTMTTPSAMVSPTVVVPVWLISVA